MTTRVVTLAELGEKLRAFGQATIVEQKAAVTRGLYRSVPDLVQRSPTDTGLYAQSWEVKVTERYARIGNFAPYAAIIEYGARPFTPPLAPLLAWAKRVLQDGSQPPGYSPAVQRLARGTQKKIADHGMKPRFILRDALPAIIENIGQELKAVKNGG